MAVELKTINSHNGVIKMPLEQFSKEPEPKEHLEESRKLKRERGAKEEANRVTLLHCGNHEVTHITSSRLKLVHQSQVIACTSPQRACHVAGEWIENTEKPG